MPPVASWLTAVKISLRAEEILSVGSKSASCSASVAHEFAVSLQGLRRGAGTGAAGSTSAAGAASLVGRVPFGVAVDVEGEVSAMVGEVIVGPGVAGYTRLKTTDTAPWARGQRALTAPAELGVAPRVREVHEGPISVGHQATLDATTPTGTAVPVASREALPGAGPTA
jgi:hypothetical protein